MKKEALSEKHKRKRKTLLIIVIILVPIGILMKLYSGPAGHFISNRLVDLVYVVFWCFVFALLFIKANRIVVIAAVFLITCGLEFLQLYSNPQLERIRNTFIGHSLIGSSFAAYDFIFYTLGAILAYVWLKRIEDSF